MKLIIFEGPSGSGKSTSASSLFNILNNKGINVGILPEFSESDLGRLIDTRAQYGNPIPDWLLGLGGAITFMADKFFSLEKAREQNNEYIIIERFFYSQAILGSRNLKNKNDKKYLQTICDASIEWSIQNFDDSIIFVLTAEEKILVNRLETRIGRKLSELELQQLNYDLNEYRQLEQPPRLKLKQIYTGEDASVLNSLISHMQAEFPELAKKL